mgnify:CR=1 FL=1
MKSSEDASISLPRPSSEAVIASKSPNTTPVTMASAVRRPLASAYETTSRIVGPGMIRIRMVAAVKVGQ